MRDGTHEGTHEGTQERSEGKDAEKNSAHSPEFRVIEGEKPNEVILLLRRTLKVLLMQLALKSETPSADLETLLQDVIRELYFESKQAVEEASSPDAVREPRLKLVSMIQNS